MGHTPYPTRGDGRARRDIPDIHSEETSGLLRRADALACAGERHAAQPPQGRHHDLQTRMALHPEQAIKQTSFLIQVNAWLGDWADNASSSGTNTHTHGKPIRQSRLTIREDKTPMIKHPRIGVVRLALMVAGALTLTPLAPAHAGWADALAKILGGTARVLPHEMPAIQKVVPSPSAAERAGQLGTTARAAGPAANSATQKREDLPPDMTDGGLTVHYVTPHRVTIWALSTASQ